MPFIPHTPESLLSRSDSKNPATTCNGITATGRPCKRTIATSARGSPASIRVARNEVVTILSPEDNGQGARAFFCWQHQEQADTPLFLDEGSGMKGSIVQLRQRTSLDTLADRLGLLELNHDGASPRETHGRQHAKPMRKQEDFPMNQQNVPVPLFSSSPEKPSHYQAKRRGTKDDYPLTFSLFCCIQPRKPIPTPVPRPTKETKSPLFPKASPPSHVEPVSPTRPPSTPKRPLQARIPTSRNPYSQTITPTTTNPTTPDRPFLPRDPSSQTAALLSLIPNTLQPELVADLLRELAKPISASDLEGFIYMFWLTPSTSPSPSKETTSALLKPSPLSFSSPRPSPHNRRSSDLIRNYTASSSSPAAAAASPGAEKSTIFIKIGRASNVQQRMNQWSRQCKHKVTVLRYYPIQSSSVSSSSSSPFPTPQASPNSKGSPSPASPSRSPPLKVPHAHKVERLIQLELRDSQVEVNCEECGKVHREWFEVEGSRAEIGRVDAVIKRWVNWSLDGGGLS